MTLKDEESICKFVKPRLADFADIGLVFYRFLPVRARIFLKIECQGTKSRSARCSHRSLFRQLTKLAEKDPGRGRPGNFENMKKGLKEPMVRSDLL